MAGVERLRMSQDGTSYLISFSYPHERGLTLVHSSNVGRLAVPFAQILCGTKSLQIVEQDEPAVRHWQDVIDMKVHFGTTFQAPTQVRLKWI
jgi:hypothetical protein